ncbi:hypothetical protein NEOLEDRAFT_1144182 [Neolentinus lepideus HHB14362 ss-1]|uniref:Uncharacterized protein n=1 Tax=Neolentinus lepideus HHB14362 ss-1 TaxID=1314782 RepID=A0A165W2D2_9AGAM|nr:hypothetical protein NEOLEDRAFT_1144182 [Neolentinus lepideus HHB14362 ss-1]
MSTKDEDARAEYAGLYPDAPTAGPSVIIDAPPSFEETVGHVALNIDETSVPEGGEEPPPDFTPYEAEFVLSGSDTVISHDGHLNQDGEALYRFLLSQASKPPTYLLHCQGTHQETRTRWVHHTNQQGQTESRTETDTVTVTDFDFYIDIGRNIVSGPVHWSVGDNEPAYRGKMIKELDFPHERCKATRAEKKFTDLWQKERTNKGLPPWIGPEWRDRAGVDALREGRVLKSSKTLRQWADEYCASPKYLKEFQYQKIVYGWNIQALTSAIRAAIVSTHYRGTLKIDFETTADKIFIRPDNKLSRILSKGWVKFVLIITLIYFPFVWLFKRFHSRGGGRWVVCGGAYALKCYQTSPGDNPGLGGGELQLSTNKAGMTPDFVRQTDGGILKLVGAREGEWFREWEGTIRSAVTSRLQSKEPMVLPDHLVPNSPAMLLDGY